MPSSEQLLREYAKIDFGHDAADFVVTAMKTFYEAGNQTFFLGKEWGSQHSNLNKFKNIEPNSRWNRAVWSPESDEAQQTFALLQNPTPEFIEQTLTEKANAREKLQQLTDQLQKKNANLAPSDHEYLQTASERSLTLCQALTLQHEVMLMVRHDVKRPHAERRYKKDIDQRLKELRQRATDDAKLLRDAGNEGCQYGPEIIEHFCRNVEHHLGSVKREA